MTAWHSLALLGLGSTLVVALGLTIAVLLALFYRSERIIPGVYVDGVAIGGRSTAEAMTLLQQHWAQQQIILVDAGHTRQTVALATLGLRLDTVATGQLAYQQGRSPTTLRELIRSRGRLELAPSYRYDPTLAQQTLATLAPQFEVPPVEAGLRLVAGQVEATPDRTWRLSGADSPAKCLRR